MQKREGNSRTVQKISGDKPGDLPDDHRRALKFYASVRLDVRRINMIKIGGNGSGTEPA